MPEASVAELFKTTSAQPPDPKRRPVPKRMADCPMRACDRHCNPCTCAVCDCDGCTARSSYAKRDRPVAPAPPRRRAERPVVVVPVEDVQQSLF